MSLSKLLKTATNSRYRLSDGDIELFKRASDPHNGVGINYFLAYYFKRELKPWQWYSHHASQKDLTVLGGVGSGKTTGMGLSYAAMAAMSPRFAFMNLAPTAWQSKIMADIIVQEASGNPFEQFIKRYATRPYPVIELESDYIGRSTLYFMSAADDARRIQGIEVDAINIDEAGQILNPFQLMGMIASRMRGTVPLGVGGKRRERVKRLSMVTASYLEAPAWLWERMDLYFADPENFLSLSVPSAKAETLSEEDLELYRRRIPEDQQAALMDAERPLGSGFHFSLETVEPCEDMTLNRIIQYHLLEKEKPTPDWTYEETPGCACIKYEKPREQFRRYWMAGDPGQGNPPRRNAPVVIVLDITNFPDGPAEMVYFDWIFGRGSYEPFKVSYKHAWDKYRPERAFVDSTGAQALWDEEILLSMGIWAEGMSFATLKNAYLTALVQMVQRQKITFPYIQGIRSQLVKYDIANDLKLAQDIVATLMMLAFALRSELWTDFEEKHTPEEKVEFASARNLRSQIVTARQPLPETNEYARIRYQDFLREMGMLPAGINVEDLIGGPATSLSRQRRRGNK
jgi:hypothetical protein